MSYNNLENNCMFKKIFLNKSSFNDVNHNVIL